MKIKHSDPRGGPFVYISSERWRLDNDALKSLYFTISKKLLRLIHLRFLANPLNQTTYTVLVCNFALSCFMKCI